MTTRWLGPLGVVLALAILNVLLYSFPAAGLTVSVVATVALLAYARAHGLTWAQLGLARAHHRSGLRWGLGVIGVISLVYLAGVLIPATRTAFLDARYHLPAREALFTAFWLIPIGTVLVEEIAFRSVLYGFLSRHMRAWKVVAVSSGLFGAWHVLPAMGFATANRAALDVLPSWGALTTVLVVAATVAFTAAGGVVAGELRRRSGSVLASVGMHWGTNALGVLFGLVAWNLAS